MSASSIEIKGIIAKSECSSSSSKKNDGVYSASNLILRTRMLQRKSQNRPAGMIMSGGSINGLSSDIRQRVLSARQHRHKSLQNQLNLALQQNSELVNENRLLKTLHKRQDNALSKYEGSTAVLPQLIKSHNDELRVWQTKYRTINIQNRELNKKLQQKDKLVNELNDRLKHLSILTTERHLEEREVLQTKVVSLEQKLSEKEEEIKVLTRRNTLEAKNFKTQLANERKKYKELCQKQNGDKQVGSSNDSDYSSAKDAKEVKHINALSLVSASSAISKETPPTDILHIDTEDDDDDDLVIKQLLDKDVCSITNNDTTPITSIRRLDDIKHFANDGAQNIHAIHQKIQNDIEKNEALLDLHCDEISRDIGALNLSKNSQLFDDIDESGDSGALKPINDLFQMNNDKRNGFNDKINGLKETVSFNSDKTKIPRTVSCLPRFNINVGGKPTKRMPIDQQKKTKLLAQLKSIESGNGCL
ncbi:kinetochore protein SLK19 [Contarinia nasturtii]|uniref:kinetochore protein SLK19 n=1 Tax=Contarinia nasturtii TaxID=265458 RepID=UPI0012D445DC|nr:kinetochore protein SLK19 [Contarinia nasturtii]XP_031620332.1 kinetochore protein SLK19 [Contarinia nasturtii]